MNIFKEIMCLDLFYFAMRHCGFCFLIQFKTVLTFCFTYYIVISLMQHTVILNVLKAVNLFIVLIVPSILVNRGCRYTSESPVVELHTNNYAGVTDIFTLKFQKISISEFKINN